MSVQEIFHIEVLGFAAHGPRDREPEVLQRVAVRTASVEAAQERAMRLFARAQVPQRSGARAEAVRVVDGAGTEQFRWSRFDGQAG